MEDFFILKKTVDKSVLCQGLTIPATFQNLFYEKIGFTLAHGESRLIKVMLDGMEYDVKLTNLAFNQQKYPGHGDILQLRYDGNTLFKDSLRRKFAHTWDGIQTYIHEHGTSRGYPSDESESESLLLFATPVAGAILLDSISNEDYTSEAPVLEKMNEVAFENTVDDSTEIVTTVGLRRIRHLSKSIGNSLKVLYGYRCQICGEFIGEKYGSTLIHAHHIDYFTKSLNNNADNIMIVCPNHHGVIHDRNPIFDRVTKQYLYPNGYVEGLALNQHI